MHTTKRRFEPSVIERLFEQPYRFQYFQAVRMLELWLRRNGVPHESAVTNYLRFQNSVSLSFPASEIESLVIDPPELVRDNTSLSAALSDALRRNEFKYIRLTPAFMGFLGTAGTLPAHDTERIAKHLFNEKDEAPRAFLDVFLTRTLALFYEAWRKYRLELKYEQGSKDQFLPLLLSFAGLGHPSLRHRLADGGVGVLDESVGHFAAAIRHRPASAVVIAAVLSEYFGQSVTVTQFVGRWYDVPNSQQSCLGSTNVALGTTALVGARVWQRDLCMRLTVGPLDSIAYESFLPNGLAARALAQMLTMFTGLCLEYEVRLVLRAADVRGCILDSGRTAGRLGWDCFLITDVESNDRCDVCYDIHTI